MQRYVSDGITYVSGLTEVLIHQRDNLIDNSIYKACQCDFAYNSNKIEGSKLTHDATQFLWEHDRVIEPAERDDIVFAANHFVCFDLILDSVDAELNHDFLFELHARLLAGTSKGSNPAYNAGGYKIVDNYIDIDDFRQVEVVPSAEIHPVMDALFESYTEQRSHSLDEILDFHVKFERVHPFSDGNGRIGRLIMFKECLRNGIMPFIVTDNFRERYFNGLRNWPDVKGFLRDTCLAAQDRFDAAYYPLAESYANVIDISIPLIGGTNLAG